MVQRMLQHRKNIFDDYTQQKFELVFKDYYEILNKEDIENPTRSINLMRTKDHG